MATGKLSKACSASLPEAGPSTGFGASAHLVLKMVRQRYPQSRVFVFARSEAERAFARELGATWAGDIADESPDLLDAIIDIRTPRILLILRNAFGGAYASFNPQATGADLVLAAAVFGDAAAGAAVPGVAGRHGGAEEKNQPVPPRYAPFGRRAEAAELCRRQGFRRTPPPAPHRPQDRHVQGPRCAQAEGRDLTAKVPPNFKDRGRLPCT